MALTRNCPKCGSALTVPQPMPEKIMCLHCRVIIKIAQSPKSGDATPGTPSHGSQPSAGPPVRVAVQAKAPPSATGAAKIVAGYELQRELARGGLGVVYLAFHPSLKHYRAIKRPQPRPDVDNEVLLARFVRETEALGTLESKHIIRAYDAGTDTDGPYLVMEYLDGESLSSLVSRHRQLPVSEACELIRQAALGLQAAHECGLVHRDIKPSNLMLARSSAGAARVTVIDWGLVKRMGDADVPANRLTKMRTELGTPDFIAPEQVRDAHSVDIRADIYSLGATFYFLLAGHPPFHGRSEEEKQLAQAREEFPPLADLRPDVPPNLLNVLKKMVKKERDHRYATPGEVAAALQPFAGAEPHRMLALLAPVAHAGTAPGGTLSIDPSFVDTGRMLDEKTQLATPPSAPIAPPLPPTQPSSNRMILWLGAGAGLFIALSACILLAVIGTGVLWNKKDDPKPLAIGENTKDGVNKDKGAEAPKPGLPNVLIDEDFHVAAEKRLPIPEGWTGDGFRVVTVKGRYALEVSKQAGAEIAKVPLRQSIRGDFSIEGRYLLSPNGYAIFSVLLEDSQSRAVLPVLFYWDGRISIAKDVYQAIPGFTPYVPAHFHLKREGKKVLVFIDYNIVGTKDLPTSPDYDTLSLSLTATNSALNWLKVTTSK